MAAKRGRSITNFGGFLNPFAIGGSGEIAPATSPVRLTFKIVSNIVTFNKQSNLLTFNNQSTVLTFEDDS